MKKNKGIFLFINFVAFFIVFISIKAQNTPPVAIQDVATADQNTTLDVSIINPSNTDNYIYTSLLDNDYDNDGDTLTVTRFSIDGGTTWINEGDTANIVGIGSISINLDGTYIFIPNTGYSGAVPNIIYEIYDGVDAALGTLLLTVETSDGLLEISNIYSCNQGFTADGYYKIRYLINVKNKSEAKGYHHNSEISNIQLINDLESIFGDTCINQIDRYNIGETAPIDFLGSKYNTDYLLAWDQVEFDASNDDPGAQGMLNSGSFITATLYPRQSFTLQYCVYVDPNCVGVVPTPSGSNLDFDNIVDATSNRGNDTKNLIITDFHTSETTVAANFFIPNLDEHGIYDPIVHPDATFEYNHRIIITNDGTTTANNVNFNLGLGNFTDRGAVFKPFDGLPTNGSITQVSGPAVVINSAYDGISDNHTFLLETGNSLPAGETVVLNINYVIAPLQAVSDTMYFSQLKTSMTQGVLDQQGGNGDMSTIDEFELINKQYFSYVFWSDVIGMGHHLDRYYMAENDVDIPSSNDQCQCGKLGMRLPYTLTAYLYKESAVVNENPGGIEEFEEVSFELTLTNTSDILDLINIQLIDNLNSICGGNVVSVSTPIIDPLSTADVYPNINLNFNGITDLNIFDGNSGLLKAANNSVSPAIPAQFIKVKFNVIFNDDCKGENNATYYAEDQGGNPTTGANSTVDLNNNPVDSSVDVFSDTDNDGVTNVNDIDDDNDGILDIVECNGLDPLLDNDGDGIPAYRETTPTNDINNDGIVDIFDFDLDGVPNHFDLDSDNDGITDIIEAGGIDIDNNGLVPVNADETLVLDSDNDGLTDDVLVDTNDDGVADIPVDVDVAGGILMPNLDSDGDNHVNALDIDSDNDGIVDNIEAQPSDNYVPPNTPDLLGLVYTNGLIPIDTDIDTDLYTNNVTAPDYLDDDSDNDTILDIIEGWDTDNDGFANTVILNSDVDNDGLDDAYDINNLTVNSLTNSSNNNQVPTYFPNVDNTDTPELDWREISAIVVLISNESEVEGTDLNFTISLVSLGSYILNTNDNNIPLVPKASAFDIKIELFTGEDTAANQYEQATATFDYTPIIQSDTEIKIDGDGVTTSFTFTMHSGFNVIKTIDDTIDELDESFILNGLVTTENTVNPISNEIENNITIKGIGTIIDNDAAPDLIMNDDIKDEGDDLVHTVSINPTVTNPTTSSSRPIEIEIVVTDDTAINPDDYTNTTIATPDTVTILATDDPDNQNTFIDYHIETILDYVNEPDNETVDVVGTAKDPTLVGTTDLIKIGTIVDKQPPPEVVVSSPSIIEGGILVFNISLQHPITFEPLANFEEINLNIFTNNGTARDNVDYYGISTTLVIPANIFSRTVTIETIEDELIEDIENLTLKAVVTSFNTFNIDAEGIGSIIDNDLPNLFSPNNDGLSDRFEIVHLFQYLDFKLQIFDRWGSIVYDYNNKGNYIPIWWDGTMNGNPVPEGVYYYTIDYNDGSTKPISGFIQLIR